MLVFFKKNINLKLLALACAIFLWVYVYYKENPFQEYQAVGTFVVPLSIEGLSSDLVVLDIPEQVMVRISGNKELISRTNPTHLEANVDLANKTAGIFVLPVQASTKFGQVEEVSPSSVDVVIEKVITREMPVELKIKGKIRKGYKVYKTTLSSPNVTLSGSSGKLDSVQKVIAEIDIKDAYLSFTWIANISIYDRNDRPVEGIKIKPSTSEVSVEILSETGTKTIPVVPWVYGNLPEGYVIKEILLQPLTATVSASREELDDIENIRTSPIDITDRTEDLVLQEVLLLPHRGEELISPASVQVLVRIQKEEAGPIRTPRPTPVPPVRDGGT